MDIVRFNQLVSRLERESVEHPGRYRARVAALTLLGFGILALMLGTMGLGVLLVGGFLVAAILTGGGALVLLLKLGKLLVLLAIPLWHLVKAAIQALFIRLPAPQGRELERAEAPKLFAALDDMRKRMRGPRFHHVLVVDEVNAAVLQRPAFGLFGWPRNYLLLGLPLLESMPPAEALAVVAHEYGHLAGSHGRFGAFIYRLRHTWGTIQVHLDEIRGWLGKLLSPMIRWYAPYFNAYTFVLARANEYQADGAAAELVGTSHAVHALKRINLVAPRHQDFMRRTFDRIDEIVAPPADLAQRWADCVAAPASDEDNRRWLADALDRQGDPFDTHPTLRLRLASLDSSADTQNQPPPAMAGESAAQAWLGKLLETLRGEFAAQWASSVATPWKEQHFEAQRQRGRLQDLRNQAGRDADEQLEMLRLTRRFEPDTDLRKDFAAFNAAHPDHPVGLYFEGVERLRQDDRDGLELLERAMMLDAECTKPACEQAHAFLASRKESAAADAYAARWRDRDALEAHRADEMLTFDPRHVFISHGLDAQTVASIRALLEADPRKYIDAVFLARRVMPSDAGTTQLVVAVKLTWWGRRRGKQAEVVQHLAGLEWPVGIFIASMDGSYAPLRKKMRDLPDARLV